MLYSFKGGKDGQSPFGNLIVVNGSLYGTTVFGGGSSVCYGSRGYFGCGTVFKVNASGKERVLYRFPGYPRDYEPYSGVTQANGLLFGTTIYGGTSDAGTIYALNSAGQAQVIHNFKGGADGADPFGGLTVVNGSLYGTTEGGGVISYSCNNSGCGTVFTVGSSGKERVLHRFGAGKDGISPAAALIDVDGTLYGTTAGGGAYGDGTVFKITTSGAESVLYSFTGKADGANPWAALTDVNGILYGTTHDGANGDGTIFAITTSGDETTIHSFKGGLDGKNPDATLLLNKGALYGTTTGGGIDGRGTIFRVSP